MLETGMKLPYFIIICSSKERFTKLYLCIYDNQVPGRHGQPYRTYIQKQHRPWFHEDLNVLTSINKKFDLQNDGESYYNFLLIPNDCLFKSQTSYEQILQARHFKIFTNKMKITCIISKSKQMKKLHFSPKGKD